MKVVIRLSILLLLFSIRYNAIGQACPSGYELTPSGQAISVNGNFSIQGGPTGGGLTQSQNPATVQGTYNTVSNLWSQARHITDNTYENPPNSAYNVYSLMTGTKAPNTFFSGSLINAFPGDPANNVAPSQTYLYSNGNVWGYGSNKEYVIWAQTLNNLVIGRRYTFSIYVNNAIEPPANATDDPIVRLRVGGNPGLPDGASVAGPTTLTEAATASTQPLGGWIRVAYSFTATATTEVFKVTSAAVGENGDDFQMTQVQIVACRPVLNISSNAPICASQTLQLTATTPATGTMTYSWSGPGGFTSTLQNPTRPNANASMSGTYTCIITDAQGQTNTQTLTVFIEDCIKDDVNAGIVNQPIPGNVKTNDVVPAGTTYGTPVAVPGNPAGATVTFTMNSDGSYTFQSNTPGVYTYDVPVCIGGQPSPCPTTRLVITVMDPASTSINPPVANIDYATTPLNTAVALPILANDGPGNLGGTLGTPTVTGGTNPGATATISGGVLTYTPAPGFVGKDTVFYQVCESPSGKCAQTSAIINVLPSGAANTTSAADDYAQTQMNVSVNGNVKTNDKDPEGNNTAVTAQNTTIPGKGVFTLNSNGSYTFTPINGFIGTVDLPYTICDDQNPSACAKATLHIVVTNSRILPVVFGNITAEFKNGMLVVNWETLMEKNNYLFEIEASTNGTDFVKIGEANIKSINGNSDVKLNYTFEKNSSEIALGISILAFAILVSFRRKYKPLIAVLIIAVITMYGLACNKKQADALFDSGKSIYIRIAQIDKDGTKSYSTAVKVNKE